MKRTRFTRTLLTLVTALCLVVASASTGCASGKSQAKDGDPEVGQPPSDDDPDREPANPPAGPDVDMSDGGEPEIQDEDAAPADDAATVTPAQIEAFMAKGPSYALTVTRVEPHRIDGSFAGFEVIAMHPSAKRFVEPELTVGDVITHINGVRMKKPDDYLAAWKLLDDVDAVRIKILRQGEEAVAVWRVVGEASAAEADSAE